MENKNNHPLNAFLCHAHEDKREIRSLSRRLKSDGIETWLDEEKLLPGQSWDREISNAISTSDVVLIFLSKASVSKLGYVQKEIKQALELAEEKPEGTIFIIPIRLDDCQIPSRLGMLHWVDLFDKGGYERILYALKKRAEQIGLKSSIQFEKEYWETALDEIKVAKSLDNIAKSTLNLNLASSAPDDVRSLLVGIDSIRQYIGAAVKSETEYNRQEQLLKALNDTKELNHFLDSIPPWRFPEDVKTSLLSWEKIIVSELSSLETEKKEFIPNVYVAGSPLSEKSKVFKGRKDIFRMLERELATEAETRPALLLFGARRTGKTSALRQLPDTLGPKVIPVTLDLQGMALTSNISTFLEKLANEIRRIALAVRQIELPEISRAKLESDSYMVFAEWLWDVEHLIKDKWMLLCLDEYEYLEKMIIDGRADEKIFQLLRSILQNYPRTTLLFSGAHIFDDLNPIWSHYLINVRTLKIGHLSENDARELIVKPIDDFPVRYSQSAVDEILATTACQPYLIQATCRDLVNMLNEQNRKNADEKDAKFALDSVLTSGSAYFKEVWSGPDRSNTQRDFLFLIAKKAGKTVSEDDARKKCTVSDLRFLTQYEILEKTPSGYRFKVELVRRWVEQQR